MRPLFLYNSLSRKKEIFTPIIPKHISFYVCGITAYDYCHIGHARAYTIFDTFRRVFEHLGYTVNYVQNFTDIDDKIIKRANELDRPYQDLVAEFVQAYFEDMEALNIQPANSYPKATEHIDTMHTLIHQLLEQKNAYVSGGDVFFEVDTFKDYGKLSKKVKKDLMAGIRVDISEKKKNPLDFVLWKAAKPNEPFWNSPWGPGRPGWHIECSAMVYKNLGNTIDIHGGGEDLIFPHHENEICQSESVTGHPLANVWLHNGFVTIKNEKMSKSTKNFFTIRDVLSQYSGDVLRFFLLKVHYRSGLQFSDSGLKETQQALSKLYSTLANYPSQEEPDASHGVFHEKFLNALCDDLNTSEAIGAMFELNKHIHKTGKGAGLLRNELKLLGIPIPDLSSKAPQIELPQEALDLIKARTEAKKNKQFEQADALRKTVESQYNIVLVDTPEGVVWKKP